MYQGRTEVRLDGGAGGRTDDHGGIAEMKIRDVKVFEAAQARRAA
jgi:hypothetical protein